MSVLPIRRVMIAVIQSQDARRAANVLYALGLPVVQLPSTGAFLSRRNVMLLVGLKEGQEDAALAAIQENCRERTEYISTPLEGAPMPVPLSTPILVGGATIFFLEVEHYEEL